MATNPHNKLMPTRVCDYFCILGPPTDELLEYYTTKLNAESGSAAHDDRTARQHRKYDLNTSSSHADETTESDGDNSSEDDSMLRLSHSHMVTQTPLLLPTSLEQNNFVPVILHRFPEEDHKDAEFPRDMSIFAFPNGFRIEENPVSPTLTPFVLTESDGTRVYGFTLLYYHHLHDIIDQIIATHFPDEEQNSIPLPFSPLIIKTRFTGYVPYALTLTSHYPFYSQLASFLRQLYQKLTLQHHLLTDLLQDLSPYDVVYRLSRKAREEIYQREHALSFQSTLLTSPSTLSIATVSTANVHPSVQSMGGSGNFTPNYNALPATTSSLYLHDVDEQDDESNDEDSETYGPEGRLNDPFANVYNRPPVSPTASSRLTALPSPTHSTVMTASQHKQSQQQEQEPQQQQQQQKQHHALLEPKTPPLLYLRLLSSPQIPRLSNVPDALSRWYAPLERLLSNLIFETPLPPLGRLQVIHRGLFSPLVFSRPPPNKLPLRDYTYYWLFQTLSIDNVIGIFLAMALEQKVLFTSSHVPLLTIIQESLASFLYPFYWRHVFIPLLPQPLTDFLCAPMPYCCGIQKAHLPDKLMLDQVIIIDLDDNTIDWNDVDVPRVADKELASLRSALLKATGLTSVHDRLPGYLYNIANGMVSYVPETSVLVTSSSSSAAAATAAAGGNTIRPHQQGQRSTGDSNDDQKSSKDSASKLTGGPMSTPSSPSTVSSPNHPVSPQSAGTGASGGGGGGSTTTTAGGTLSNFFGFNRRGKKLSQQLHQQQLELAENISKAIDISIQYSASHPLFENVMSNIYWGPDGPLLPPTTFDESAIEEAFLKFWVKLLKNYRDFLSSPTDLFIDPFDKEGFLESYSSLSLNDTREFVEQLCETQLFSCFAEDRVLGARVAGGGAIAPNADPVSTLTATTPSSPQQAPTPMSFEILLFDELIEQYNKRTTPFLADTSLNHVIQNNITVLDIDTSDLPDYWESLTCATSYRPGYVMQQFYNGYTTRLDNPTLRTHAFNFLNSDKEIAAPYTLGVPLDLDEIWVKTPRQIQAVLTPHETQYQQVKYTSLSDAALINLKYFSDKRLYSQHFRSLLIKSSKHDALFKDVVNYLTQQQAFYEAVALNLDKLTIPPPFKPTSRTNTTIDNPWIVMLEELRNRQLKYLDMMARLRNLVLVPFTTKVKDIEGNLRLLFSEANKLENQVAKAKTVLEKHKTRHDSASLRYLSNVALRGVLTHNLRSFAYSFTAHFIADQMEESAQFYHQQLQQAAHQTQVHHQQQQLQQQQQQQGSDGVQGFTGTTPGASGAAPLPGPGDRNTMSFNTTSFIMQPNGSPNTSGLGATNLSMNPSQQPRHSTKPLPGNASLAQSPSLSAVGSTSGTTIAGGYVLTSNLSAHSDIDHYTIFPSLHELNAHNLSMVSMTIPGFSSSTTPSPTHGSAGGGAGTANIFSNALTMSMTNSLASMYSQWEEPRSILVSRLTGIPLTYERDFYYQLTTIEENNIFQTFNVPRLHAVLHCQNVIDDTTVHLDRAEILFQIILNDYGQRMPEIISHIRELNASRLKLFKQCLTEWASIHLDSSRDGLRFYESVAKLVDDINVQQDLLTFHDASGDFWAFMATPATDSHNAGVAGGVPAELSTPGSDHDGQDDDGDEQSTQYDALNSTQDSIQSPLQKSSSQLTNETTSSGGDGRFYSRRRRSGNGQQQQQHHSRRKQSNTPHGLMSPTTASGYRQTSYMEPSILRHSFSHTMFDNWGRRDSISLNIPSTTSLSRAAAAGVAHYHRQQERYDMSKKGKRVNIHVPSSTAGSVAHTNTSSTDDLSTLPSGTTTSSISVSGIGGLKRSSSILSSDSMGWTNEKPSRRHSSKMDHDATAVSNREGNRHAEHEGGGDDDNTNGHPHQSQGRDLPHSSSYYNSTPSRKSTTNGKRHGKRGNGGGNLTKNSSFGVNQKYAIYDALVEEGPHDNSSEFHPSSSSGNGSRELSQSQSFRLQRRSGSSGGMAQKKSGHRHESSRASAQHLGSSSSSTQRKSTGNSANDPKAQDAKTTITTSQSSSDVAVRGNPDLQSSSPVLAQQHQQQQPGYHQGNALASHNHPSSMYPRRRSSLLTGLQSPQTNTLSTGHTTMHKSPSLLHPGQAGGLYQQVRNFSTLQRGGSNSTLFTHAYPQHTSSYNDNLPLWALHPTPSGPQTGFCFCGSPYVNACICPLFERLFSLSIDNAWEFPQIPLPILELFQLHRVLPPSLGGGSAANPHTLITPIALGSHLPSTATQQLKSHFDSPSKEDSNGQQPRPQSSSSLQQSSPYTAKLNGLHFKYIHYQLLSAATSLSVSPANHGTPAPQETSKTESTSGAATSASGMPSGHGQSSSNQKNHSTSEYHSNSKASHSDTRPASPSRSVSKDKEPSRSESRSRQVQSKEKQAGKTDAAAAGFQRVTIHKKRSKSIQPPSSSSQGGQRASSTGGGTYEQSATSTGNGTSSKQQQQQLVDSQSVHASSQMAVLTTEIPQTSGPMEPISPQGGFWPTSGTNRFFPHLFYTYRFTPVDRRPSVNHSILFPICLWGNLGWSYCLENAQITRSACKELTIVFDIWATTCEMKSKRLWSIYKQYSLPPKTIGVTQHALFESLRECCRIQAIANHELSVVINKLSFALRIIKGEVRGAIKQYNQIRNALDRELEISHEQLMKMEDATTRARNRWHKSKSTLDKATETASVQAKDFAQLVESTDRYSTELKEAEQSLSDAKRDHFTLLKEHDITVGRLLLKFEQKEKKFNMEIQLVLWHLFDWISSRYVITHKLCDHIMTQFTTKLDPERDLNGILSRLNPQAIFPGRELHEHCLRFNIISRLSNGFVDNDVPTTELAGSYQYISQTGDIVVSTPSDVRGYPTSLSLSKQSMMTSSTPSLSSAKAKSTSTSLSTTPSTPVDGDDNQESSIRQDIKQYQLETMVSHINPHQRYAWNFFLNDRGPALEGLVKDLSNGPIALKYLTDVFTELTTIHELDNKVLRKINFNLKAKLRHPSVCVGLKSLAGVVEAIANKQDDDITIIRDSIKQLSLASQNIKENQRQFEKKLSQYKRTYNNITAERDRASKDYTHAREAYHAQLIKYNTLAGVSSLGQPQPQAQADVQGGGQTSTTIQNPTAVGEELPSASDIHGDGDDTQTTSDQVSDSSAQPRELSQSRTESMNIMANTNGTIDNDNDQQHANTIEISRSNVAPSMVSTMSTSQAAATTTGGRTASSKRSFFRKWFDSPVEAAKHKLESTQRDMEKAYHALTERERQVHQGAIDYHLRCYDVIDDIYTHELYRTNVVQTTLLHYALRTTRTLPKVEDALRSLYMSTNAIDSTSDIRWIVRTFADSVNGAVLLHRSLAYHDTHNPSLFVDGLIFSALHPQIPAMASHSHGSITSSLSTLSSPSTGLSTLVKGNNNSGADDHHHRHLMQQSPFLVQQQQTLGDRGDSVSSTNESRTTTITSGDPSIGTDVHITSVGSPRPVDVVMSSPVHDLQARTVGFHSQMASTHRSSSHLPLLELDSLALRIPNNAVAMFNANLSTAATAVTLEPKTITSEVHSIANFPVPPVVLSDVLIMYELEPYHLLSLYEISVAQTASYFAHDKCIKDTITYSKQLLCSDYVTLLMNAIPQLKMRIPQHVYLYLYVNGSIYYSAFAQYIQYHYQQTLNHLYEVNLQAQQAILLDASAPGSAQHQQGHTSRESFETTGGDGMATTGVAPPSISPQFFSDIPQYTLSPLSTTAVGGPGAKPSTPHAPLRSSQYILPSNEGSYTFKKSSTTSRLSTGVGSQPAVQPQVYGSHTTPVAGYHHSTSMVGIKPGATATTATVPVTGLTPSRSGYGYGGALTGKPSFNRTMYHSTSDLSAVSSYQPSHAPTTTTATTLGGPSRSSITNGSGSMANLSATLATNPPPGYPTLTSFASCSVNPLYSLHNSLSELYSSYYYTHSTSKQLPSGDGPITHIHGSTGDVRDTPQKGTTLADQPSQIQQQQQQTPVNQSGGHSRGPSSGKYVSFYHDGSSLHDDIDEGDETIDGYQDHTTSNQSLGKGRNHYEAMNCVKDNPCIGLDVIYNMHTMQLQHQYTEYATNFLLLNGGHLDDDDHHHGHLLETRSSSNALPSLGLSSSLSSHTPFTHVEPSSAARPSTDPTALKLPSTSASTSTSTSLLAKAKNKSHRTQQRSSSTGPGLLRTSGVHVVQPSELSADE